MRPPKPTRAKRDQKDDGYRVNREIFASEVRLISDDGSMLGVYPVREALRIAEDKGLDLIEIAPNATPPTCKIMDYGKWKYENKKKAAVSKKHQTVIVVKEIQLRPRTDQHDIDTKLRHARRFLLEGDKVKINCRFLGREMAHQDQGVELLSKFAQALSDVASLETPPKMEGKQMFALIAPDPLKIKELAKQQKASGKTKVEEEATDLSETK